jgi:hypothetical protein
LIRDAGIDGAWVGVIGTLVGVLAGGAIGYFITNLHDRQRRKQEIADLKVSLYAEIADRAARCVNDYLKPWRDLKITSSNSLPAGRVEKFRPTDPVVFPGVAGKIGLLGPTALLAVTQFYFRLDALSQAIESICNDYKRHENEEWVKARDEAHVRLIVDRMRSCFEPALRAIEKLDFPGAAAFDLDAAQVYPHLRRSGTLREALKNHASD